MKEPIRKLILEQLTHTLTAFLRAGGSLAIAMLLYWLFGESPESPAELFSLATLALVAVMTVQRQP